MTKTASKKAKKKKNPWATTSVLPNIGILANGTYRVRKTVNGICYSKVLRSKAACKKWLASF